MPAHPRCGHTYARLTAGCGVGIATVYRYVAERPYFSGKHKKHGTNVQMIADPFGRLLWASPALAGAVHDLKAARTHGVIEALTAVGLCCWADKGYQGAGGTVPDHPRPSPGTSLTRQPPDDTALVPRRRGVGGEGAIEDRPGLHEDRRGPPPPGPPLPRRTPTTPSWIPEP